MSRPHWVLSSLFCAAFGLLTTLMVAWGIPLITNRISHPPAWSNAQFWADDTHAGHYQLSRTSLSSTARFLHILSEGNIKDKPYYKHNPPPPWVFKLTHAMEGEDAAAGQTWWGVDTLATGWPLRAFRGGQYEPWQSTRALASTLTLIPDGKGGLTAAPAAPGGALTMSLYRFGGPGKDKYAIPYRPIPRGIILNTLFFGAAWGLVFLTGARLRRGLRRHRHRCSACNYDLRGLETDTPCPECGRGGRAR